jgi:hypothetical protein
VIDADRSDMVGSRSFHGDTSTVEPDGQYPVYQTCHRTGGGGVWKCVPPNCGDASTQRPRASNRGDHTQDSADCLPAEVREAYEQECAHAYEQKRQERELRQLTRRAIKLRYALAPVAEPPLSSNV